MKRILQVVLLMYLCIGTNLTAKSETFSSGSYIINMGSSTQTIANGLKPYGLVYELLKTYKVPVKWVIRAGKAKDAIDFTCASVDYKGGTFIVPKEYISSAVAARIAVWEGIGVIGAYTTSSLTVNVTETLTSVPNWTLNTGNIAIAQRYFTDAGIPSSAYNNSTASGLTACNDIFVLPHTDPTWATVGNLYAWNRNNKGAIWSGCHAVSELENLSNPADTMQKLNFLSTNGLIDFNSHADGSAPFSYFFNRASYNGAPISARADDPVFQMIGNEDAAHTNGSEQVYIPKSGSAWRNTTHIGCFDSIQSDVTANANNGPAAITLYGRGFGLNTAGLVMYQGGHDLHGTGIANVAALRQFFNFSFEAMKDKVPAITASSFPSNIAVNMAYNVSVTAVSPVGSTLTYQWTSSCPGTFANASAANTTFTPSYVDSTTTYTVSCSITDACARYSFKSAVMSGMSAVLLPVTLLSFDAKLNNTNGELSWITTNELNTERFEIYRSINGKNYTAIASVKTEKNENHFKQYKFIDENIINTSVPRIFYQLKIIDAGGKYYWSNVSQIAIVKNNQVAAVLSLYPNPCTEFIDVDLQNMKESNYNVLVMDNTGRIVIRFTNPELTAESTLRLDVNAFEKGLYFIQISDANGTSACGKFIKR